MTKNPFARWRSIGLTAAFLLVLRTSLFGQVIAYEGNVFPELQGWEHELAGTPGAERSTEGGRFVQRVSLPQGWPGPNGDYDFYVFSLGAFVGVERFFVEWSVSTDNPTWLLDEWQVPVVVVAGGNGPGFYHTTITDGVARFLRSLNLPISFADFVPQIEHHYRIELHGDSGYYWYLDGTLVEAGKPEGAYPDQTATLTWGAGREYVDSATSWNYIRFGVIPEAGTGNFDSDTAVTLVDHYFVMDCLTKDGPGMFGGPGNDAGPGCRFADFDADADVDLLDLAEVQNAFAAQ